VAEQVSIAMTGSGTVGDIASWSINEFTTPTGAGNSSGGIDNARISTGARSSSKFIIDNEVTFSHEDLGEFYGTIDQVEPYGIDAGFDLVSFLRLVNVNVTAQATGSMLLSQVFSSYVSLATSSVPVAYEAASDPTVVYGGWTGNLWDALRVLAAVNRLEIAVVETQMVVRDIGTTEFSIEDSEVVELRETTDATGLNIEIVNQNTELVTVIGSTKYNYSENPSLEANATDWAGAVVGVTATQGRVVALPYSGTASYRSVVTAITGASTDSHSVTHTIDLTGIPDGSPLYSSIAYIPTFTDTTSTMNVRVSCTIGGVLRWSFTRTISRGFSHPYFVYGDVTVKPVGATDAYLTVEHRDFSTGDVRVGDQLNVDAAFLTVGSAFPFFDGNSVGATWTGASNNSVSSFVTDTNSTFYDARMADRIFSVDAGETVSNVITTTNFPDYLATPTQSPTSTITVGTYYVSDSANAGVSTSNWNTYGGAVDVEIGSVPGTFVLTLTGPQSDIPGYPGPYYLGYFDGFDRIPALSIAGTGVLTNPETVRIVTGADDTKTSVEVASTLDSQFVTDLGVLFDISPWISVNASGPTAVLTARVATNRLTGFGVTAGSLIRHDESIYRIIGVNISGATTTLTAAWHVTVDESETLWAGNSAATFDSFWADYDAQDFQIAPLRFFNTANSGGDWLFPSPDLYPRSTLFPGIQP